MTSTCPWMFSWVWLFCDPMDCSLPGFFVQGIFQARILECVAISFSRGSSQSRDWTHISCIAGGFFTPAPLGKPNDTYTHLRRYTASSEWDALRAHVIVRLLTIASCPVGAQWPRGGTGPRFVLLDCVVSDTFCSGYGPTSQLRDWLRERLCNLCSQSPASQELNLKGSMVGNDFPGGGSG